MSQQRLTQCPHCKASFKVSEEQLGAANGRVRCGACMNIFDALAYSASDADIPSPDTSKTQDEAVDLEDSILQDSIKPEALFADNPEEDKHEAGYSGSKSLEDEFSTSFLELDNEPNNDLYSTSFQKIDEDLVANENSQSVDESWTQNILDDIENERSIEPSISLEPSLLADPNDSHIASETGLSDETLSSSHHYDKVEFHYQQDAQPGKRHWSMTCLFLLINMSLIALLLAQAVWFHYEKLVKYPQVASIYEFACAQLNCTLPELEDVNKIKSNNLIVRSHPTRRRSLVIDTVIINKAPFDQNFPNLALYFSDINKNVIAQRLIKPSEYLSGDLLAWKKMPQEQPIHISLEIVDPGKEAVNYSLKFFSTSL